MARRLTVKRIDQALPSYPLPSDYTELGAEGQRLARVNGCRQHLLTHPTVEAAAQAYAQAVELFDVYYLWPDEDESFNPLFYANRPLPTPPMHQDLRRQIAMHWLAVAVMPRGSGKTYELSKEVLHGLVSEPGWSCIYATSTHPNMEETADRIRTQLAENPRINDDWAPEFPDGRIMPRRGEGPRSLHFMRLMNGSKFRGLSAKSRMRGGRPRIYYLDDPEFDPTGETSMSQVRNYMQTLVFQIALPMIMQEGGKLSWRGTFVSKRHYLWHAMSGRITPDGFRAEDPRFDLWHRLFYPFCEDAEDGTRISCWPQMWPSTRKERLEKAKVDPGYATRKSIEEVEASVGRDVFGSEYMGRPGDLDQLYFGELQEMKHGYWFEEVDDWLNLKPWKSTALICWYDSKGNKQRMMLKDFLVWCRLFITGDTSATARPDSDYKVCTCMAVSGSGNILFVLDTWGAQAREHRLVEETFKMADKWRCVNVFPEAVREGRSYYESLVSLVGQKAKEMTGTEILPTINPLLPGMITKTSKIAALLPRFEYGLIKLPLYARGIGRWRALFEQIEDFNPDAEDGGLPHDDFIDTVAMSGLVIRGRLHRSVPEHETEPTTALDHLKRGEVTAQDGQPYAYAVDWQNVSQEDFADVCSALANAHRNSGESRA